MYFKVTAKDPKDQAKAKAMEKLINARLRANKSREFKKLRKSTTARMKEMLLWGR